MTDFELILAHPAVRIIALGTCDTANPIKPMVDICRGPWPDSPRRAERGCQHQTVWGTSREEVIAKAAHALREGDRIVAEMEAELARQASEGVQS